MRNLSAGLHKLAEPLLLPFLIGCPNSVRFNTLRILGLCLTSLFVQPIWGRQAEKDVMAVNVLLELDTDNVQQVRAMNTKLRQAYPEGFALDASHIPHITLLQCYVRRRDLAEFESAVQSIVKSEAIETMKLEATGYEATPAGLEDVKSCVLKIDPTPELRRFHEKIVQAVQPWVVHGGDANAFVPPADGSPLNPQIIQYVDEFLPKSSGSHYDPHITLGLAPQNLIHPWKSKRFDRLPVKLIGLAIYHVGEFGTARKKLLSE